MSKRENVQPKYRKPTPGHVVKKAFIQLNLTQKAARQLLPNASAAAVCRWLNCERRIPQWAASILASAMRSKASQLVADARELESVATDGYRGHAAGKHALGAWRARRAAS